MSSMQPAPSAHVQKCADVSYDMRGLGAGDSAAYADLGDLLWNPKMGEGHVLVAEVPCNSEYNGRRVDCGCGGWGMRPCPSTTLICECGQDGSWRDHHYAVLARRSHA
jgi:hypothetical protein